MRRGSYWILTRGITHNAPGNTKFATQRNKSKRKQLCFRIWSLLIKFPFLAWTELFRFGSDSILKLLLICHNFDIILYVHVHLCPLLLIKNDKSLSLFLPLKNVFVLVAYLINHCVESKDTKLLYNPISLFWFLLYPNVILSLWIRTRPDGGTFLLIWLVGYNWYNWIQNLFCMNGIDKSWTDDYI